ncbi:MAG: hypothetical protein PHN80_06920 [Hespellia sp.]|nr:hypothetical protein [Hespellia sp.]
MGKPENQDDLNISSFMEYMEEEATETGTTRLDETVELNVDDVLEAFDNLDYETDYENTVADEQKKSEEIVYKAAESTDGQRSSELQTEEEDISSDESEYEFEYFADDDFASEDEEDEFLEEEEDDDFLEEDDSDFLDEEEEFLDEDDDFLDDDDSDFLDEGGEFLDEDDDFLDDDDSDFLGEGEDFLDEEDDFLDDEEDPEFSSKSDRPKAVSKRIWCIIAAAGVLAIVIGAVLLMNRNNTSGEETLKLKAQSVQVEYGTTLQKKISDYATGKHLEKAKLDISKVNVKKVGTYKASISYGKKKFDFEIVVKDTVAPEVVLKSDIRTVVGKELFSDMVAESMTDKAGIAKVTFADHTVAEGIAAEDGTFSAAACKYDAAGEVQNTLIVTDKNGNSSETVFNIYVTEDYEARVQGITDRDVTRGASEVDYMAGISWDEMVASVSCDASKVDINKVGDYEIVYTITGTDEDQVTGRSATVITVNRTAHVIEENSTDASTDSRSTAASYTGNSVSYSGNSHTENSQPESSEEQVPEETPPASDPTPPATDSGNTDPGNTGSGNTNSGGTDTNPGNTDSGNTDPGNGDTGGGTDTGTDADTGVGTTE